MSELHRPSRPTGDNRTISGTLETLRAAARERILVLDGAMGTQIQALGLDEDDYAGHGHGAARITIIRMSRSRAITTFWS